MATGSRVRQAVVALAATFFLLGFLGAAWISRIPAVQAALSLDSDRLGLALLGMPVGSVAMSLVLPRALHGSSRAVVGVGLPAAAGALCLMPLAGGTATLGLALVAFGAATAAVDVGMNAHAVRVQRLVPRSMFARWHAMWSLGGFAGAGLGGLLAAARVSPSAHFAGVAVGVVVAAVPVAARLLPGDPPSDEAPVDAVRSWTASPRVLVLAAVSVAAFVVEVGAADWVGVFVRRVVAGPAAAAAGAFAAFALPHFVVRLFGDRLIDRLPRRRLLAGGLLAAAAGFAVVTTSTTAGQVFAGLALTGAGIALVVPVAFAAAGSVPGVTPGAGVATAAGWSYVGWAVTPPAIGALAGAAGLRVGLLLPLAAALAAAALVGTRADV